MKLRFAVMPPKKPDQSKVDTRVTASLSLGAYRRLSRLAELLGTFPGTEAGRGLEDWVFSDEFEKRLQRAEEDAVKFAASEENN